MAMIKSVAYALLLGCSIGGVAAQIEAVDDFVVSKYLGRWTQLYGNTFSEATATRGLTCVGTFYGFDEPSGNITVFNFGREGTPDGELSTITGYAYGTDENEPAQLKVSLAGVPFDGDYWIVGLGPATFGSDELYQWAVVSGPPAEQLFILVRDVEVFEESYEEEVLAFVTGDLGFTGPEKEPQRIVQEGCLPIEVPGEEAEEPVGESPPEQEEQEEEAAQIEAVDDFEVSKYLGRWTQLYGNTFSEATATRGLTCVGTFYGFDEPSGNITVFNYGREGTPDGELSTITGYAYGTDENEPAQLKVSLAFVPFDGDYWIVGLGPATFGPDELYQWAVVSGPPAEQLFILVRDVEVFEESYEEEVLAFVTGDLGFTGPEKEPQRIVQEGCLPIEVPGEEAEEPVGESPPEQEEQEEEAAQIEAVDDFDVSKYLGRWYQLYGNTFSEQSATRGLTCVGTQYGLDQPTGNITVFNFGRVGTPTGELSTITGYAYGTDESEPAQLKVSLAFAPVDGDYWIVGLGPATFGSDGLYQWAVVSGPTAEQLFILVRDVEVFEESFEEDVLAFVTGELGFTGPEKEPQRIVQEGCAPLDPALVPDGKFSCDVYEIVYG